MALVAAPQAGLQVPMPVRNLHKRLARLFRAQRAILDAPACDMRFPLHFLEVVLRPRVRVRSVPAFVAAADQYPASVFVARFARAAKNSRPDEHIEAIRAHREADLPSFAVTGRLEAEPVKLVPELHSADLAEALRKQGTAELSELHRSRQHFCWQTAPPSTKKNLPVVYHSFQFLLRSAYIIVEISLFHIVSGRVVDGTGVFDPSIKNKAALARGHPALWETESYRYCKSSPASGKALDSLIRRSRTS